MTLPESVTVDHPRKREEKTQNTDSLNTIKLEQPTQLEAHHNTIKDPKQNVTQACKEESTIYTVCGHLHLGNI